ncbi:prepilin-type N-terminal cleavage/methylation domain-containing protein [Thalassotalea sp. Y01]|uniref:prepilin-type N-terminal cleavage/methylation domain-containing protein n=1 Tax=Thalassotalea sp. Y01 TaxID=2729613 RepID=UPI00145D59BF|nr:prepilin-type N-terminal cleavage/methylation domain-containing protein [Thalassotalea sp. Y01]NMP14845.1 prepilin-type N-terminal cleavage/methylation domain-containing protein [Thalassotalea sp. Y01]
MNKYRNFGFGLIEVLVALAIMAVGLLAVASFQTSLIGGSAENKAKAEAMAIAQQRLEQMRNISNDAFTAAEFETLYTATDGYSNDTKVVGSNTSFLRQENITDNAKAKEISVMVSWETSDGVSESVELVTSLGFESPVISGEIDNSDDDEFYVRSATGRAELGEGQVTDDDRSRMVMNDDLTGLVNREDGDLRLTSGDDIVLTLKDACQIDDEVIDYDVGECTGFVEISGHVYIDTATQNQLSIGEVYVKASDAAFCQRYYVDDTGQTVQVTADSTEALTTANGDYSYYQYTCYLGGGWHGNIGIILGSGISQSDKVCVGDPTSADAFDRPQIATRRVYRGMAFEIDDTKTTQDDDGDDVYSPIVDDNGDTIYYSVGVKDALILPNPDAEPAEAPHDFVVNKMQPGDSDGELCVNDGIMVRTDANVDGITGGLFVGNPDDFYCLNNMGSAYIDDTKLEAFGYSVNSNCPFDPSDPPSQKHQITGSIKIGVVGDDVPPFTVNTSDGPLNCTADAPVFAGLIESIFNIYTIDYRCDVYDWAEASDLENGWSGYIQVNPDLSQMTCSDLRQYHDVIKADHTATEQFVCKMGQVFNVVGDITQGSGGKSLAGVTISDANGVCLINAEKTEFECSSDTIDDGDTWTGSIYFQSDSNLDVCLSVNDIELVGKYTKVDGVPLSHIEFTAVSPGTFSVSATLQNIRNGDSCP